MQSGSKHVSVLSDYEVLCIQLLFAVPLPKTIFLKIWRGTLELARNELYTSLKNLRSKVLVRMFQLRSWHADEKFVLEQCGAFFSILIPLSAIKFIVKYPKHI